MQPIKILVTGGAGNIGSALIKELIKNPNYCVVAVDNLVTGNKNNLPQHNIGNWRFIKCDVNNFKDISPVMISNSFDYVFHYAALVGVQRTLKNPIKVLNDIGGMKNVLCLAKNTQVKRVFFSSSSEVYGEPVEFPQHEETTPLNSRLTYAVVKNVGESMLKAYHREYDLDYTIFRFFNTYGPNQSSDFVIPRFIHAALENKDITIFGDGLQTRTFCYIEDNVETIIKILEQNKCVNEIINIGNDNEITILDLAKLVIDLTGSKSSIVHLPALKEGDMTRRKPDITKMKEILNKDLTSLDEGILKIAENIRSYKSHLQYSL
jgi:UDP-glucuronate decarboxylase